ncbi:MAG: DUF4142 domain-containing protein [Phenylobacterium sp.]
MAEAALAAPNSTAEQALAAGCVFVGDARLCTRRWPKARTGLSSPNDQGLMEADMRALILTTILTLALRAAASAAPAPVDSADYVREAAQFELFERKTAELAQDKGVAATVLGLAIRLAQGPTDGGLAEAAARASLPAPPAELGPALGQDLADLAGLSGSAFDRAYIAGQRRAGEQALRLHEGYAAAGDQPALRDYAGRAASRVRQHLAMLKSL